MQKCTVFCRSGAVAVTRAGVVLLFAAMTACQAPPDVSPNAKSQVVAEVGHYEITERDLAPLLAAGLDRANAIDRSINRAVAAGLGRKAYADEVDAAVHAAEAEIAANVYSANRLRDLTLAVTDEDIEARYDMTVKSADFNGYQAYFALYPTLEEAQQGRIAAIAGAAPALAAFHPAATSKDGKAAYLGRADIPYNLGGFIAKLKEGEFTEPAVVRNGYLVFQLKKVKALPKPKLTDLRDQLRRAIADERLLKELSEARAKAGIQLR